MICTPAGYRKIEYLIWNLMVLDQILSEKFGSFNKEKVLKRKRLSRENYESLCWGPSKYVISPSLKTPKY